MKNFKIFSFFLIFVLILSLSLQGCGPKESDTEKNPENIIEGNQEDNEEENNIEKNNKEKDEDSNQEDNISDANIEIETSDEETSQEESTDTNSTEETLEENSNEDKSEDIANNEKDKNISEETENPISKDNENEEEKTEENLLKVQGNITNELALSLVDLKSMKDIRFSGNYYSLNSFGTTDHTEFTGVNLWNLLNEKAGISPEASQVSIIAIDGYQMDFEVEQIKKQDYIDETNPDVTFPIIIAWEENGEEYDPEEGPPYKLVVGQTEAGDVNKPQWVSVIDKIIVE